MAVLAKRLSNWLSHEAICGQPSRRWELSALPISRLVADSQARSKVTASSQLRQTLPRLPTQPRHPNRRYWLHQLRRYWLHQPRRYWLHQPRRYWLH